MHKPPWYVDVSMDSGIMTAPIFNSLQVVSVAPRSLAQRPVTRPRRLQAFFPAVQALVGDVELAIATHEVRRLQRLLRPPPPHAEGGARPSFQCGGGTVRCPRGITSVQRQW